MSFEGKKRWEQYMKVRDVVWKSGSSSAEKKILPRFDDLDIILKPTSKPKNVVITIKDSIAISISCCCSIVVRDKEVISPQSFPVQ